MYDIPLVSEVYIQPSSGFGAATETQTYFGPKGRSGFVRDIDIDITADMVGTTTVPEILVGTASGLSEYARFRLGTTAVLGYTSAAGPRRARQLTSGNLGFLDDFSEHVKLGRDSPNVKKKQITQDTAAALQALRILKDVAFVITRKAGVGGAPAGTGRSRVFIDWV